jgi:hypothetical protein
MNFNKDLLNISSKLNSTKFKSLEDHSLIHIQDEMNEDYHYTERRLGQT